MTRPVGAGDPALEQARLAQLAPHAYLDGWRGRYAPLAGADAPASVNAVAVAPSAAPEETDGASRRTAQARVGAISSAAAARVVQTMEPERGARPKPVPPPRSGEQRKAALDAARQRNAELKALQARLRTGELTLVELLDQAARGDQAAARILIRTVLLALPGIRAARASQLMAAAGIGPGRRAGALSAGQEQACWPPPALCDSNPLAGGDDGSGGCRVLTARLCGHSVMIHGNARCPPLSFVGTVLVVPQRS